jgi:hypothetical protein
VLLINYTPDIDRFSNTFSTFFRNFKLPDWNTNKIIHTCAHKSCEHEHTVEINCTCVYNKIYCRFQCIQKPLQGLRFVIKSKQKQEIDLLECTRWFKYDRDDLCVNKSQFVPVIFEPPCTWCSMKQKQTQVSNVLSMHT